jgi:hypothetical protein
LIWGWATWREAWEKFDFYCSDWPGSKRTGFLRGRIGDRLARKGLAGMFDEAKAKGDAFHVWDFQWTYACLRHGMRSIHPPQPLVSNVGFGPESTHTTGNKGGRLNVTCEPMRWPLSAPASRWPDKAADARLFYTVHPHIRRQHKPLTQRVRGRLGRWKRSLGIGGVGDAGGKALGQPEQGG